MLWRQTFPVGALGCNCTVLADLTSKEAVVIDPGDEVPKILTTLSAQHLRVVGILHTHAHIDHIGGAAALAQATAAPAWLHPDDTPLYAHLHLQAAMLGLPDPEGRVTLQPLKDGQGLCFGAYELGVLHTPGHSPGSCSFTCAQGDLCFSGDTLFAGGVGRTDLWGGDQRDLQRSIQDRLYTLPAATHVIPGHGPLTTIERERDSNPFVRRR